MIRKTSVFIVIIASMLCVWTAAAESGAQGKVNINTASIDQLQLLPRVGPSLAGRIVEFRETNGAFESVDELVAVKGIGEKALSTMKPYVSVKGDTTLAEKVRQPRKTSEAETAS